MSLLKLSSSVKGSAVMSAIETTTPGWAVATASYTGPDDTAIWLVFNSALQHTHMNLSLKVKGPGAYKYKADCGGDASADFATNLTAGDLAGVGVPIDNFSDPSTFESYNVLTVGDTSAAGVYEISLKVNGAPVDFKVGVLDSSGLGTEFTFNGFSHGEGTIRLTKA